MAAAGCKEMAKEIKSIEINLSRDLTAANYVKKIQEIREKLAATRSRKRPVCPEVLKEDDPKFLEKVTWFDIILVFNEGKSKVRLRIRSDQLYFQGFCVNDTNKWFELGDKPLIESDSETLGYGHNYSALLRAAGFAATDLTAVTVGREKLMSAAHWLVNPPNVHKRAEALLIVIVMFCESARFIPISNFLRRTWQESKKVPQWVDKLVHRWGKLSGCVLFYDKNPKYKWVSQTLALEVPPNFEVKEVQVQTVEELSEYLGILMRDPKTIGPPDDEE